MNSFEIGQVVKGIVCGTFIIVRFRTIGSEQYAQLKEFDPESGRTMRSEFALPLDAIKA